MNFSNKIKLRSIRRKVLIGFAVNLMILIVVGVISVRSVRRISNLMESSERVNDLLSHIYQVRINEKNIHFFSNPSVSFSTIDSLTSSILNSIRDIRDQNGNSVLLENLKPIPPMMEEYNKLLHEYARLEGVKKLYDTDVDNAVEAIDTLMFGSRLWQSNLLTADDKQNIVYASKRVLEHLYFLRKIEQSGIHKHLSQGSKDSLSSIIETMKQYTQSLKEKSVHPLVQEMFQNVNIQLQHFREGQNGFILSRERQLVVSNKLLHQAQGIEDYGEIAQDLYSHDIENLRGQIVSLVIFLVFLGVLSSGFLAFLFSRQIKRDEEIRELSEAKLTENKNFLEDIIRNNTALISVKTSDGYYTLVNDNWLHTFQKKHEDVIGKQDRDIFEPELAKLFCQSDKNVMDVRLPVEFENEFIYKHVQYTYLTNKFPIFDSNGTIKSVCAISTDISLLRKTHEELELSRENYSRMVQNVPGIVFKGNVDEQRSMIFLSDGFDSITGYHGESWLHDVCDFMELVVPDDRDNLRRIISASQLSGTAYEAEYRICDVKGIEHWLHEKGTFMKDNHGHLSMVQGVMVDVSQQKEVLSEVFRRDRLLEGVAAAVRELIGYSDLDFAISRALRIIGQSASVDITFIFRNSSNDQGEPLFSHLSEWERGYMDPIQRKELQNLSYRKLMPSWYFALSGGNQVIGHRSSFVDEEQLFFNWMQVENLLLVPVFVQQVFWGFIGFANHKGMFLFADSQRAIFKAFADTVGIAVAKDQDSLLLIEAKEAAEAATSAKSDFLARMSHEIRTPLNAVVGWTHLALNNDPEPRQADYLHKIQSSSNALLGIINDILDFSKIEAGKMGIECIPFDLETVLEDLSGIVSYKAAEKGLEIVYDIQPRVPLSLIGDPLRLGQILINLVNNAVKFTSKGEVVVSVDVHSISDNDLQLLFVVRDTGMGITAEQKANLFDSFSQADASTTRQFGGTGLGLSICKRLTMLMGGDIWVESTYGEGSSFYFTVQLTAQKKQKKDQINNLLSGSGLSLLVYDEHQLHGTIISRMVNEFDYACQSVATVDALKSVVEDQKVSLLIIDMHDRLWDNYVDVVSLAKAHQIPVVALISAFACEDLQSEVEQLHVDALVYKPFSYTRLLNKIQNGLGKIGLKELTRQKRQLSALNELRNRKGVSVLLVEDNETNQLIGVELLEIAGVAVDVASNGQEALNVLCSPGGLQKYDLVFMDIQMPVLDGYSATRAIRDLEGGLDLPIVAMTAEVVGGTREKCIEAGMDEVISKPVNPEEIYEAILLYLPELEVADEQDIDDNEAKSVDVQGAVALPVIKGLNVAEGVKRLANRIDFYERLLVRFYADHVGFADRVKQSIDSGDNEVTHRLLHTFKGITGTISASELYNLAILTEQAYKGNDPGFVELFGKMSNELDELMHELKNCKSLDIQ